MTVFIDNGVTGTIGAVRADGLAVCFCKTPSVKVLDYTKVAQRVTRIVIPDLKNIIVELRDLAKSRDEVFNVYLERPFKNPRQFVTTVTAVRAFEATISLLESLDIGYQIVDSKEWQKGLLPSSRKRGTTSAILKKESHDIGIRMFPQYRELIQEHEDADGILGAYALNRR